jgi:glucuronoarabinoxylan endo-1,4-beta-xylanase
LKKRISMKTSFILLIAFVCLALLPIPDALAQNPKGSFRIDPNVTHQNVTGFGGFVNSPQFAYNHMTSTEIKKLWGEGSEMGYNIMRIYLPIGESNWSQSLATASWPSSWALSFLPAHGQCRPNGKPIIAPMVITLMETEWNKLGS